MHYLRLILLIALLSPSLSAVAQSLTERFKTHIEYLADDKLKGRDTGSEGEEMAAKYIIEEFEKVKLEPAGPDGAWKQPFTFVASRRPSPDCSLKINGKLQARDTDYLVFPETGDGAFSGEAVTVGYGIAAPEIGWDDYARAGDVTGKIVVIERGSPEQDNPHSKYAEFAPLAVKMETAIEKGAAGIAFVNPEKGEMGDPILSFTRRVSRAEVPVFWLRHAKASQLAGKTLSGDLRLRIDQRTGHNVVARLDHEAPYTIVIGAHFDHLGMGDEGSLHRGQPAIHNGADDNASGTAMLIELARALDEKPFQQFNYVFIAFSGEEKGLLGSNYFCKNPSIDLDKVSCMINFDMVGRLDANKNTLGINGVGTSPFWNSALPKIQVDDMKVKTSNSGVGPSDHTSFYLQNLPVLHFFSGTHSDYHKPSDDAELINYSGIDKIYRYVLALMEALNADNEKLAFTATKNEDNQSAPRWKVSLGVIPDYLFDGEGMRIDGITEGRPAAKAGLKTGDVVVKMGPNEVKDMMSYMRALSKFDKGDKVKVTVLRDGKAKTKKVVF